MLALMCSFPLGTAARIAPCVALVLGFLAAPLAHAEEGAPEPPAAEEAAPPVDLDLLLRLPDSFVADGERRGGASRTEWRARFAEARSRVAEREAELDDLQTRMEGLAGDSSTWSAGAPGLSNPDPKTQTLSYKLRQDLRRAREGVVEAERALRDLRVEADLADVPESWRE
jgi:hypothetical protein